MKKLIILSFILSLGLLLSNCDKPEVLKHEATLKVENTSASNKITGVYFGTVGPGVNNKISSNIGPGESKSFTIDIDADNVYDIKITCDNADLGDFVATHHSFYWNDTYVIELRDNDWYDDDSWF